MSSRSRPLKYTIGTNEVDEKEVAEDDEDDDDDDMVSTERLHFSVINVEVKISDSFFSISNGLIAMMGIEEIWVEVEVVTMLAL